MHLNVYSGARQQALTALLAIQRWGNVQQIANSKGITDCLGSYLKHQHQQDTKKHLFSGSSAYHSGVITADNHLIVFGNNNQGQLGLHPASIQKSTPIDISFQHSSLVIEIACGAKHTLMRLRDGRIFYYGDPSNSTGNQMLMQIPLPQTSIPVQIACGYSFSLIRFADGQVWCFGSNSFGQFGLQQSGNILKPVPLPVTSVVDMACGDSHILLQLQDGGIMACGNNLFGQLGLGHCRQTDIFTPISDLSNVVQIAAGTYHTLLLLSDGRVMAFGSNRAGQLGLGQNIRNHQPTYIPGLYDVVQIACGARHSLLRLKSGRIMTFGSNEYGQLGLANKIPHTTPVAIPLAEGNSVTDIACGSSHSLILLKDGRVMSIGSNRHYERGFAWTHRPRIISTVPEFVPQPTLIAKQQHCQQCKKVVNFLNQGLCQKCYRLTHRKRNAAPLQPFANSAPALRAGNSVACNCSCHRNIPTACNCSERSCGTHQ